MSERFNNNDAEREIVALKQKISNLEEKLSERENRIQKLEQVELAFNSLYKYNPCYIAIINSATKIIVDVNDIFTDISGYSKDEIIGKTTLESGIITAELKKNFDEYVASGIITNIPGFFQMKNGTAIEVKISFIPVILNGEYHTITIGVDIREKRNSEERFRLLLEHAVDGIFHGNSQGNFISVNTQGAEMTGYSKEEILKLNMKDLFTVEELQAHPLRFDLLKKEETVRIERKVKRKDGSLIFVEMNTKMMPDGTYQSFFRNTTERKKIETELILAKEKAVESDFLKSSFLANMSHEIRTPLNGILGFTDLLLTEDIEPEKRDEFLKIINTNGKQLLTIINDIIDISKIEAEEVVINPVKCFLNNFMFELFTFYNGENLTCNNGNVELKLDIPVQQSILIYIDDVRLRQIFNNLIGNALKFTHQGTIEFGFSINIEDYIITFFVKDTGIGIPEDMKYQIFERFIQADNTITRSYGGTGLGLAITKGLVELMNGRLWVESEEGKGSSFYFTLPYNTVLVNDRTSQSVENAKPVYKWKGKTILVVEDDYDSYLYLETLLEKNEASVIRAIHGEDAILQIKSNSNIDLVLLDIQTPVMNGIDAALAIRGFNRKIPIIAQTANVFEEDKDRCLSAGCNAFVSKPIEIKELFHLIDNFFKRMQN